MLFCFHDLIFTTSAFIFVVILASPNVSAEMYPDTVNRTLKKNLFTITFVSLHLLLCCTWSNGVFLLNVVLKSFSAVPEEADLFTMNNSCQWRDETFQNWSNALFYALDLVFVFVSFSSENSILFSFFHLYCVATICFECLRNSMCPHIFLFKKIIFFCTKYL